MIDVVERDHFDRAVHVAVGYAHQTGRHAGPRDLDGVGVSARAPSLGAELTRDVLFVRHLDKPLDDLGVHVGSAIDHRPFAQGDVPFLFLVDGRTVGLYREADDLLPIILRHTEEERRDFTSLDVLQVQPAMATRTVPLLQVTDGIDVAWEDPIIGRRNRRRKISFTNRTR